MKKSLILLSLCSAVMLSSCGTSARYAYSTFDDGIYYRASKEDRNEIMADNAEVRNLIEQTRQEAARFSDTILIAGTGKTDRTISSASSPAVPVGLNIDNYYEYNLLGYDTYCSYWDWKYWDVFGPWGRYSGWHDWYSWYSPWFPGIYDPWYPSWGLTWSFAWNSWGWYGPAGYGYWWGGYWDPWYYGPWGYPVAGHIQPSYYGKRDAGIRTATAGTVSGSGRLAANTGKSVRGTGSLQQKPSTPSISVSRGRSTSLAADRTTSGRFVSAGTAYSGRTTGTTNAVREIQGNGISLGEKYISRGDITASGNFRSTAEARQAYSSGQSYRRQTVSTGFRNPFERTGGNGSVTGVTGYRRAAGTDTDRTFEFNRSSYGRNTFNGNTSRTTFSGSTSRSISSGTASGTAVRSYSGGSARTTGGGSVRSVRR